MKNHIKQRDYELISAYLDNQLGGKERALFEANLKADPELRKELQEISKTRLLVRNLPMLRAPRNYFVQEKAAQRHPTSHLAPVFGIVSAVASVLLAFVIFGSTFFSSKPQVAMAPIVPNSAAPLAAQQAVEGSVTLEVSPSEAAPIVLMGAPILNTPTPDIGSLKIGQSEVATPTTIYLYAYPPTSTPEGEFSISSDLTETAHSACDEYYRSGENLIKPNLYNCPTPTGTYSANLESILTTSTEIPTDTPTPTSSETPTPTPTASPSPTPTATAPAVEKLVEPQSQGLSTEATSADQALGAGNPIAADQEPAETPAAPNVSFLNYIMLTLEISLAAIAVIAGITAIILRIRAR